MAGGWGFDDELPSVLAIAKARALLEQHEFLLRQIELALLRKDTPLLSAALVLDLHRIAMQAEPHHDPGNYRCVDVEVGEHFDAPHWQDVPRHVDQLCLELETCRQENAIYLAARTIWKLCWIHPFSDGNGRTARAAGYYVFSVSEGVVLPGRHTLHEQILENDAELFAYLDALRAADRSFKASGKADITLMMSLVERLLVRQLS